MFEDSVLAFDSNSKLIIQDLDKAKISPDKVIKDNSIEEPGDNYEDIEMKSCSDVNTENTEQRKSSLRNWKRVLRNKGISNSKVSVLIALGISKFLPKKKKSTSH